MNTHKRITQLNLEHDNFVKTNTTPNAAIDRHIEQIASLQCQLENKTEQLDRKNTQCDHMENLITKTQQTNSDCLDKIQMARNDAEWWVDKYHEILEKLRREELKYSDANAENAKLKRIISEAHTSFHKD